jgi:hypothetical protein
MADYNYVFFHDIFPNFNHEPCKHYNEIVFKLSLTCKLFNDIYNVRRNKDVVHECDICEYKEISCDNCILNKTRSCDVCRCKKCGISKNYYRYPWLDFNGNCEKCSDHPFRWVQNLGTKLIESITFTYGDYEEHIDSDYLAMYEEMMYGDQYNHYDEEAEII